jgi:hypothetical protein
VAQKSDITYLNRQWLLVVAVIKVCGRGSHPQSASYSPTYEYQNEISMKDIFRGLVRATTRCPFNMQGITDQTKTSHAAPNIQDTAAPSTPRHALGNIDNCPPVAWVACALPVFVPTMLSHEL